MGIKKFRSTGWIFTSNKKKSKTTMGDFVPPLD
jgi:hypothetical protein